MGKSAVVLLLGAAVGVGGALLLLRPRRGRVSADGGAATRSAAAGARAAGVSTAPAHREAAEGPPVPQVSPGGDQATPADLLERARRIPRPRERLAAYERLVRAYPGAPQAAAARREALALRRELAAKYRAAGDAYNLRNILSEMLWKGLSAEREAAIKREITALNQDLIFSRRASPDGTLYTIRPRDTLGKIARRYKVTPELLGRINGIKNLGRIRFGDRIKVIQGPFDVLVELGRFRLTVLLRGRFVKEYPIGIGRDQATPIGRFVVKDKLVNPMWYGPDGEVKAADDPENPLGERWIGITGGRGYGIHGTIEPESIGTACSRGCIRMLEKDVEEVYDFVVPKLSRVTIVE